MSTLCATVGHAPSVEGSTLPDWFLHVQWKPKGEVRPDGRGAPITEDMQEQRLVTCRRCDKELGYVRVEVAMGDAEAAPAEPSWRYNDEAYPAARERFHVSASELKRRLRWDRGVPSDLGEYSAAKVLQMVLAALHEEMLEREAR